MSNEHIDASGRRATRSARDTVALVKSRIQLEPAQARATVRQFSQTAGREEDPRGLRPRVSQLLRDRNGLLPVWIRAPKLGPEHYSGLTRSKLYELVSVGRIRSVSIREPGQVKGCRLFDLASVLDFIERAADAWQENRKAHPPDEEVAR